MEGDIKKLILKCDYLAKKFLLSPIFDLHLINHEYISRCGKCINWSKI